MKKFYTYLLCVVVALCCCSCKIDSKADNEQSHIITKQGYLDKFSTKWGFNLPDKKIEEYWCIINTVNDYTAYFVFKVSKEEIDIELKTLDNDVWESQIEYSYRSFIDVPHEYLVDFSHDLLFTYQENYYTPKHVDKLYLIYDDTINTLTIIDIHA